ncbi:MAG: type II secretion system GspH family protein, partial [Tenericutes bacterium]|nr:type II secretion system GspH family protein [Mycoplasmatota bacterium]
MKNKKGFTLVEIIITLAIVITITTVAVGSYIGISSQKKKEEWKLVKDQIETAAEQYFSSNKYMYEGITGDAFGNISVGTLVNKDYLNKVVDPMTGKQVSYCSEIQVSFKDGKYKGTYIGTRSGESKSDCSDKESQVVIRNPDGPKGDITYHKYNDDNTPNFGNDITKNGWFNIEKLGGVNKNLAVCVNLTKGGKNIASATLNGKDLTKYSNNNKNIYCTNVENGQHNNQQFVLKDSLGKTLKIIDSYNVDSTYPEGKIYLTSTGNGYNSNV